jgi:NAD(P)-dependent dehydrogenase (short-subunit alcohol dehydrogenase family)
MRTQRQGTNHGKIAEITGAGSGIGRARALALHADGFSVVLAGRRRGMLEETARWPAPPRPGCPWCPTDVSDPGSIAALFETVQKTYGRIDLLFDNAGTSTRNIPIDDLTLEQWANFVAINLNGSFLCARHASPYAATKHALTGLTRALSLDGREFGHCQRPDRDRQRRDHPQ